MNALYVELSQAEALAIIDALDTVLSDYEDEEQDDTYDFIMGIHDMLVTMYTDLYKENPYE